MRVQGAAGDGDRADPSGGMGQPGSSCSAEDEGGGAEAGRGCILCSGQCERCRRAAGTAGLQTVVLAAPRSVEVLCGAIAVPREQPRVFCGARPVQRPDRGRACHIIEPQGPRHRWPRGWSGTCSSPPRNNCHAGGANTQDKALASRLLGYLAVRRSVT